MCFDAFKLGVVSKRLLNETTWNIKRRRKRTDNTKKRFLENQSHSAEFQQSHWNHVELTTPEKTTFQRVDLLLNQQTHRTGLQPRTDARLPCSVSAKEQKNAWTLAKLWIWNSLKLSFDHRWRACIANNHQPNFKLRNMILTASFFWRLTPC